MKHEILRTCGVSAERDGRQRLEQVDILLLQGETMGIVGRSGAGKHTLSAVVTGEGIPTEGLILLEEQAVQSKALAAAGFCIRAESRLFPSLTVAENLLATRRAGRLLYRKEKMRVLCREILTQYGMEQYLEEAVSALPQSVQHRLLLVRIALQGKQFAVLQNLAGQYSLQEQMELWDTVQKINAHGIAVLYLTEDLDYLLCQLPQYTVMDKGRVLKRLAGTQSAKLRTYLYGYHAPVQWQYNLALGHEELFRLQGYPIIAGGVCRILDCDGETQALRQMLRHACAAHGLLTAEVHQQILFESFVDVMTVRDNVLLSAAPRISGIGFHIKRRMLRLLQQECVAETGLSNVQMLQACSKLTKKERLQLLLYRWRLRGARVYLFYAYDKEECLLLEQVLQQLCDIGGAVIFVSTRAEALPQQNTPYIVWKNGRLQEDTL